MGKWDVQRYMIWAKYGDLGIYGDHMGIYEGNEEWTVSKIQRIDQLSMFCFFLKTHTHTHIFIRVFDPIPEKPETSFSFERES